MNDNRFWMIGLLVIMAVLCATALALVDDITAPIIALKKEVAYKSTVLDVFGIQYPDDNSDAVLSTYAEKVEERDVEGLTIFSETATGRSAISISGGGFQGLISLIASLDGTVISGFRIVSEVETPGLGAKAVEIHRGESEPWFTRQFKSKSVEDDIKVTKDGEEKTISTQG